MISLSAIGFAVADGETRRVRWIQAMRRCILRMNDVIRYERLPLAALLARMDLRATREQRELDKAAAPVRRANGKQRQPAARSSFSCARRAERRATACWPKRTGRRLNRCSASLGGRGWRNSFGFFPRRTGAYIRAGREPAPGRGQTRADDPNAGRDGRRGGVSDADLGGCAMNIDLLFQIAGVGILIFAVNQVLQKAGRGGYRRAGLRGGAGCGDVSGR